MNKDEMSLKSSTLVKLNVAYTILLGSVKGREYMHGKAVEERIMID
jgi:hypothetical protein